MYRRGCSVLSSVTAGSVFARSGQDSELRWFLAAVTVVSIVALYYLQLDWLKLISRLPDLGKTFGLLALLDFTILGLTLEPFPDSWQ